MDDAPPTSAGLARIQRGIAFLEAHLASPDFELYDERWDPTTGEGEIDIWVPIAEEAAA